MPFFHLYIEYNFLLNAIAGFFYFTGVYFLGYLIHKTIFSEQYNEYFKFYYPVTGVLIVSIMIQVTGFYSFYWFKDWMIFLFYFLCSIGLIGLIFAIRKLIVKNLNQIKLYKLNFPLLLIIFVFVNSLLISLTPLSKHDELFYHAVFPGRIVLDNGINFYRYPLESAVLPHMLFHFSTIPFFSVGLPNASNFYAYLFSIILFYFFYKALKEKIAEQLDEKYIYLITLLTLIGMHHLVFHTTLGGHAFNELCMFSLLFIISNKEKVIDQRNYYFYTAVLSIGVLGSKISYLPLIILILGYFTALIVKSKRFYNLFLLYIPFLILYLPIIIFTYIKSGSPFGPFFIEFFGSNLYKIEEVKSFIENYSKKLPYLNLEFSYFLKSILFDYSILVVSSFIFLLITGLRMNRFIWLLSILMVIAIYTKLPHDIRFLGGFLYFSVILSINYITKNLNFLNFFKTEKIYRILILYIFCFLAIMLIYSFRFHNFYLTESSKKWMFKNIGLYEEYVKIDNLIDSNAVILLSGIRGNGAYSPRIVIYDFRDFELHKEKIKYLLHVGNTKELENNFRNYALIKIYENQSAMVTSYRTPFREEDREKLTLYKLEEKWRK